jgi:hypothetical protein
MSENREREERAARLLWKQVERLRGGEAPSPSPEAPGSVDDEENAALTRIAAELAAWMGGDAGGRRRASARQKMWARIAEIAPAPASVSRRAAPARGWGRRLRPWHGVAAAAAIAVILLAPRATRPPTPAFQAAPHATVVRELRQLAANTVPPEEARAAWRHMLECPGCFERYRLAWEQHHGRSSGACTPSDLPRLLAARGE